MFCPKCGAEYDDSFSYCPQCSTKNPYLEPPPVAPTRQAPASQWPAKPPVMAEKYSWNGFLAAFLIIIAVLMLVSVLLVVRSFTVNEKGTVVPIDEGEAAQKRTCQSNLRTVDGAIQSYESMFENPTYPTSLSDMMQPGTKVLNSIPTCPSGNKPYKLVDGTPPTISCPNVADHTI